MACEIVHRHAAEGIGFAVQLQLAMLRRTLHHMPSRSPPQLGIGGGQQIAAQVEQRGHGSRALRHVLQGMVRIARQRQHRRLGLVGQSSGGNHQHLICPEHAQSVHDIARNGPLQAVRIEQGPLRHRPLNHGTAAQAQHSHQIQRLARPGLQARLCHGLGNGSRIGAPHSLQKMRCQNQPVCVLVQRLVFRSQGLGP